MQQFARFSLRCLSARGALPVALLIALAVRLAAAHWWEARLPQGQRFAFGDSHGYWYLAQQLAEGEPYQYGSPDARIFRTPGYPVLLAALFVAVGDHDPPTLWARWLSVACGLGSVAAVYWLARQLFGALAGILAALCAALSPGAICMSVVLLSEAPCCPLLVAHVAAGVAAWNADTSPRAYGWATASGLLVAGASLMRPSCLLLPAFTLLAGLCCCPQRGKQVRLGVVVLLATAAGMLPWWVRNYAVAGRFVATTLQVGASLYDGIGPQATGRSEMSFVAPFTAAERAAPPRAGEPFEVRLDRRFRQAALAYAGAHPMHVLGLMPAKLWAYCAPWPGEAAAGWTVRAVFAAGFVPVLCLAVLGARRARPWNWPVAACLAPTIYFLCLHLVFVSSMRYREPPWLALLPLAGSEMLRWLQSLAGTSPAADPD